jgi:hypothetical protein
MIYRNFNIKNRAVSNLVFLVFFLSGTLASAQSKMDREIEIDLDAVAGARKYEVKISDPTGARKPETYTITTPHFARKLTLGKWKIETRSFDKRGVAGPWTEIGNVEIGFKAPEFIRPKAQEKLPGIPQKTTEVTVEWTSFSPLAKYHATLRKDGQDKPVFDQAVTGTMIKAKLPLGQYTATLKSIVPEGVPMDGKDPDPLVFELSGGKLATPVVKPVLSPTDKTWSWGPVKNAKSYDIKVTMTNDPSGKLTGDQTPIVTTSSSKPEYERPTDLAPGKYLIEVSAAAPSFDPSDPAKSTLTIDEPKSTQPATTTEKPQETAAALKKKQVPQPRHTPVNFIQGTIGPVFWNYDFNSTSGQKFNLVAGTVTAIAADVNRWFAITPKSAWAAEIRGRQTNVSLFENGGTDVAGQDSITVADRRVALIARRRKIIDRVGIDAILGFGTHHYTYLVQSQATSVITPVEGNLYELYLGGALDWQVKNGSHASFDLTFHPVGQSVGISADHTWQYTASLKYMRRLLHDRSYVSAVLENFRSRVNTRNTDAFEGEAETTSTWYRFGLGLAFKI